MPEPTFAEDGTAIPPSIKIGDKEYTAKEIQTLETQTAELRRTLTEKGEEISSLRDKTKNAPANPAPAQFTEDEKADLEYFKRMGFSDKESVQKIIDDRLSSQKEEIVKEAEDRAFARLSAQDKQKMVQSQIEQLSEEYDFVDKEEFKTYIKENAERFGKLSVNEIAQLKYGKQFEARKIKPSDLPSAENSDEGRAPEPKIKPMKSLSDKGVNSFLRDKLFKTIE